MRLPAVLLAGALALVLAAGCGGDDDAAGPTTAAPATTAESETETETGEGSPSGPVVRIDTGEGEVEVAVEIAETPEDRQLGLMHRESLPEDSGMIFLFEGRTSGGFWMKNTLIPLSIAFVAASGEIVRILDMEPCDADPCEIYDPGVFYASALEVNQGAFARWGVEEGDRLTLDRG